ncbi:aminoacyl-histidine dipeptidase [candidate division KSB1 bacterium]|nr:aminoacyl-histidine dipeptidase [candidate division KSB1 bacterium]
MSVISNLEPKLLWKYFDEIRKIPRPSGKEAAVAKYVISVAGKLGLEYEQEKSGNVLIRKPGSKGHENAPAIVLQGHLDMVCEKNSDKEFNFDTDPIQLLIDGEWLKADGTTLGADNGIGVAAALAILEDDSLVHGPIEALFTVDEETGLNGAMTISPDLLNGRILINMDSEDIGLFSIGCAGGADTHLFLPVKFTEPKGDARLKLFLSGLRGGHSGVDIHEQRGNALKILNRLLFQISKKMPVQIVRMEGGDKHNAIPREATADVVVKSADMEKLKTWFKSAISEIQDEFSPVEKDIKFSVTEQSGGIPRVLDEGSKKTFLALVFALPHGPLTYSRVIKNLVETSNNVASIKFEGDRIFVVCSSRSSNDFALEATRDKIAAIGGLAGAKIEHKQGYPGWQPNPDSNLLKIALQTFKEVAGKDAAYEAIHAGLECGLIGEKFSGMDMISVGPTIKHPHSPDERVNMKSVDLFYKHVVRMLEVMV